jgi:hypothetical protein
MRVAQRRAMDAAVAGRADLRERVEIGAQTRGVDAERRMIVVHRSGGKIIFNSATKNKSF